MTPSLRGLLAPGLLLGVGLGGFVDGIALHQLLQWHHMLSSSATATIPIGDYPVTTVEGLQMNTLWDGIFHTTTWLAVLGGLGLLYSRVTHARGRVWASRTLWGLIAAGWGLFNLVEGVVNHYLLGIHHVRSGAHQGVWDAGFLVVGALLVAGGLTLARTGEPVDIGR